MNTFLPNPRPGLRPVRPGLILLAAVVGVTAIFVGWLKGWNGMLRPGQTATKNNVGKASLPFPVLAALHPKFREAAAYWDAHKARLRQLLTVDHPAALARRNERFPDVAAVVKFGDGYAENFERQNHDLALRADEQDKKFRAKRREIESHDRGLSSEIFLFSHWLEDTQPVAGNLTISDLARQFGPDDPSGLIYLHRIVAATERRTFHDEAAAQRVEALPTSQAMVAYIREARPRWDAEQTQVDTDAGYDAPVSEYMIGSQCAAMLNTLTKDYQRRSNAELDAIDKESDAIFQTMNEPQLAAASRDDPESRRLLTELQALLRLREQEKTRR